MNEPASMSVAENYLFLHMFAENKGELTGLNNVLAMAKNCESIDELCAMIQTNIVSLKESQGNLKEQVRSRRLEVSAKEAET